MTIVDVPAILGLQLAKRTMRGAKEGPQAHWQPHRVGIHLHNPIVSPRFRILEHPVPEPDEDIRVESRAPISTHIGGQTAIDQICLHDWLFALWRENEALIAVDSPFVAAEEAELTLSILRAQQAELVAVWQAHCDAEQRWRVGAHRLHGMEQVCIGILRLVQCLLLMEELAATCKLQRGVIVLAIPCVERVTTFDVENEEALIWPCSICAWLWTLRLFEVGPMKEQLKLFLIRVASEAMIKLRMRPRIALAPRTLR